MVQEEEEIVMFSALAVVEAWRYDGIVLSDEDEDDDDGGR